MLARERAGIEKDVDAAIENFLAGPNRQFISNILHAIRACPNPKEGFAIWKEYAENGNNVALQDALSRWNISTGKHHRLTKQKMKARQYQDGQRRSLRATASRTLRSIFDTAAVRRKSGNKRGSLTLQQDEVFDSFMQFRRLFEGPSVEIHPLTAALASHMRDAVAEKMLTSYDELKKQSGKPLVDEKLVRNLREAIIQDSLARFDRLADESYGTQEPPMPTYGFDTSQMPGETKFGIEIEGFSSLDETYPQHLTTLAEGLKKTGLSAVAALKPKTETPHGAWSITYDFSIVSPLRFNGRHRSRKTVIANSSSFELVSPILYGQEGQEQLGIAANVLHSLNFRSNRSCGLHMHVSIEDATLRQRKNLVKALFLNEDALDQLISPERRGDGSKYALSHRHLDTSRIDAARTTEELVEIINPGKNRNYKFDMTGLVTPKAPPTIQYRGAGGAAYLNTVGDYAVILGNFTQQALENPDVQLEDVIEELVAQRSALRLAEPAPHTKKERSYHPEEALLATPVPALPFATP